MRRIVLAFIFTCFVSVIFAQRTRTEEVFSTMTHEVLKVLYITNDSKTDTLVAFYAKDHRYQQLTDLITLYSGSVQDYYDFMVKLEKFYNENEPEVSDYIDGYRINILKVVGYKCIWWYEKESDGNGYHYFMIKGLVKMRLQFANWCQEKGLKLNITESDQQQIDKKYKKKRK